jgi:hypothetical protein
MGRRGADLRHAGDLPHIKDQMGILERPGPVARAWSQIGGRPQAGAPEAASQIETAKMKALVAALPVGSRHRDLNLNRLAVQP